MATKSSYCTLRVVHISNCNLFYDDWFLRHSIFREVGSKELKIEE